MSRDVFWRQVITYLKLKKTPEELEREWISYYELIPETRDLIRQLRRRYQVWYLSNNVKERAEALEKKFWFKTWFDGGIFSHEVGLIKPDPKIYRFVLKKTQAKPEEAVFIDNKETSLEPAKAFGITPILFTSPDKLEAELKQLKIL